MSELTVDNGSKAGSRIALPDGALVLGRHVSCDYVLDDDTVSRQHARFARNGEAIYVEDLQSRNGTYVNGKRITARTRLHDGDRVQLYDVGLTFCDGRRPHPRLSPGSGIVLAPESASLPSTGSALNGTMAEIDLSSPEFSWSDDSAGVRLQAMLDVTRTMRNWSDLDDLYAQILESLVRIFPQLDRTCILRLDEARRQLVLDAVRVRSGDAPQTIGPIMQAIVKQAFREGKALLSVDLFTDRGQTDSVHEVEQRCVMCAPLIDATRRPLGAIYLDTVDAGRRFTAPDLDVLACVAILASQAVEQATLHNARYRAVVDTSVDGIITFDEQGAIESFNPAACELFGFGPGELRGVAISGLVPELAPLISPRDEDASALLCGAFRRHNDTMARRFDGSRFPIRLAVGELKLAGRRLFTASIHDITEQKRVENTLKTLNDHLEREVRRRTGYVQLHQDVAVIANEAESVPEAFQAALDRIREFTGWLAGRMVVIGAQRPQTYVDSGIWSIAEGLERSALIRRLRGARIPDGASLVGRVIATGESECAVSQGFPSNGSESDSRRGARATLESVFAFPVLVGDEVVAVAEFYASQVESGDASLRSVMRHVGTQLGRVIERRRLQQELVDAVWRQQRVFGQDLHDTLGQELTGIGMVAASVARKLAGRKSPEAETARELSRMIQHAKQGVRRLAKGMLPVEVDAHGLKTALEELAEVTRDRCAIGVSVHCEEGLELEDNEVATHLFRIAQEALTNAVRHARASRLSLHLQRSPDGEVELSISDDGTGILRPGRSRSSGVGLRIMRYRAEVIDAKFEIRAGTDGGTVIACRLPRSTSHA